MEPTSVKPQLEQLLSDHDIPFHAEGEWLVPYGELPAIRATWYAGDNSGRFDIEVLLPDNRVLHECFAGMGSGTNGVDDALHNFTLSSFYVLLAAFWKINDPDKVTTDEWIIGGKPYTAFVGHFGARGSVEANASIPDGLLDSIQSAVMNGDSSLSTQWFRSFFCNVAEEFSFEALANNEPWEAGVSALQGLAWQKSAGYYSVRNFLVLREKV